MVLNSNDLYKHPYGPATIKVLEQYEVADTRHLHFSVSRISAGAINANFKLYDGDKSLLLKIFCKNSKLPIDRQEVFRMQEELAILGLAPTPIFLSESNDIYCEQWIDLASGKAQAHQKYGEIDYVDSLAEVLYNIHNSFVSAPVLDLHKHWEMYWERIESPSESLQEKYNQANQVWKKCKELHHDKFVLCHNDLHIDHISFRNGPVFDWEYAGLGCLFFDIASCCAVNQLTDNEIIKLCSSYAHLANTDVNVVIDNVKAASELVSFTYELWTASLAAH